jgi:hypothetical protein
VVALAHQVEAKAVARFHGFAGDYGTSAGGSAGFFGRAQFRQLLQQPARLVIGGFDALFRLGQPTFDGGKLRPKVVRLQRRRLLSGRAGKPAKIYRGSQRQKRHDGQHGS